jgi:hypothetical protein
MGKGSAPRPFTDREIFESNWDKIFKKEGINLTQEELDNVLIIEDIVKHHRKKQNSDDVSPHTLEYEYELNKSTGEVQKSYSRIDVISQNGNEGLHYPESLEQGTSKPNDHQFDNIKDE